MEQNTIGKIVLSTSDEAAKFVGNIRGWVSSNGRFFGNDSESERMARYDGCTHRPCEDCGEPTPKSYIKCQKCRDKYEKLRHEQRTVEEWDENGMLYSHYVDRFFNDWDEVEEYACEHELSFSSLQLVICEPVYLHQIDTDEWVDELPEEGDLPDSVEEALSALNAAIKKAGPVSWQPGGKAAKIVRRKAQ